MKLLLTLILFFSFLALPVLAQSPIGGLQNAAPDIIKAQGDVPTLIGTIIKALLSLIGVLFLCLMVYAGYTWMTAEGEADKVKKAKNMITAAIIGLIIVLSAYSITVFVLGALKVGA